MTDGKTTHAFSMNTVNPLDRDFWFIDAVTLPIYSLRAFTDATSSLPIYSVRAFTDETSSSPTNSLRALFWQIEIWFIYMPTAYFDCKYFTLYTRDLQGRLLRILPLGKIPAGEMMSWRSVLLLNSVFLICLAQKLYATICAQFIPFAWIMSWQHTVII